ncbi:hypothetical protein D6D02_02832 [Aureobasidium pullulans]|uniref:Uncharacterized protein n=1 Tax=Aureobasidium pullulans TaxID=5580 RepID=A0A4S9KPT2_AURPU|nr:hypothetical protein D6D24_02029 [Aureobasidium pullulans]THY18297.1 hypothetical protein D6D02_02832 [Aureobasidium pullulans]THZ24554.1 hypothetical protein D6C89_04871 [Aureobasidium pullulans]
MLFSLLVMPSLAVAAAALPTTRSTDTCDRQCMTGIVSQLLLSMESHDPYSLPLATSYRATENSHPAALGMMTAWHTITKTGTPSLLAIDTTNQTAYFALDVSEGNDAVQTILRGRIAVVSQHITEIELFINRFRGDHGFSFSSEELPANYAPLMSPPTNRTKASRAQLWQVSNTVFSEKTTYNISVGDSCVFTEMGWNIVDPGTNGNGSTTPLSCIWPDAHPYDNNARVALVIDEELGFVVQSGMIPGMVEPYGNISAFIPDALSVAQVAQDDWVKLVQGEFPLPAPMPATGDTLEVLQFYDGKLQAMQINVYLSGPNQTSSWLY